MTGVQTCALPILYENIHIREKFETRFGHVNLYRIVLFVKPYRLTDLSVKGFMMCLSRYKVPALKTVASHRVLGPSEGDEWRLFSQAIALTMNI